MSTQVIESVLPCPSCKEQVIVKQCTCLRRDVVCSHNPQEFHFWHTCTEHDVLVQTAEPFEHDVSTAECTCSRGKVIAQSKDELTPQTNACPHTELTVSGSADATDEEQVIRVTVQVRCACGEEFAFVGLPLALGTGTMCYNGGRTASLTAVPYKDLV